MKKTKAELEEENAVLKIRIEGFLESLQDEHRKAVEKLAKTEADKPNRHGYYRGWCVGEADGVDTAKAIAAGWFKSVSPLAQSFSRRIQENAAAVAAEEVGHQMSLNEELEA